MDSVPIRSASRSFSVLRTINEYGSISLSELARLERLPYPTAFRIMQTLVHEGLIEQEREGKRYQPTSLVQSLSSGYKDALIREAAEPVISELTQEIGWPVFLSERVARRLVILACTHNETTLTFFNWKVGSSFPLLGSATGLVWLAHQAEDRAKDFIDWERSMAPQGRIDAGDVLRSLDQVRTDGYAWRPSRYEKGGRTESIAVPVMRGGRVNEMLTVTYFALAMRPNAAVTRYVGKLQDAVKKILATAASAN